jgi:hypothetical protein
MRLPAAAPTTEGLTLSASYEASDHHFPKGTYSIGTIFRKGLAASRGRLSCPAWEWGHLPATILAITNLFFQKDGGTGSLGIDWYGQVECDCLIKTKHCDCPCKYPWAAREIDVACQRWTGTDNTNLTALLKQSIVIVPLRT